MSITVYFKIKNQMKRQFKTYAYNIQIVSWKIFGYIKYHCGKTMNWNKRKNYYNIVFL